MGGKTSQSSSQVSIPPQVLARYNSVNAQAQQTAQTPFQQYSTNPAAFVAPVTAEQNAGINTINQASNSVNPLFNAATSTATNAYQGAVPGLQAAGDTGARGFGAAQSYLQGATGTAQGSYAGAQPFLQNATQTAQGSYAGAQPYMDSATQTAQGSYAGAQPFLQGALGTAQGSYAGAQPYLQNATQTAQGSYAGAQPTLNAARGFALAGGQAVDPSQLNIGQYMNPYLNTVLGSTANLINQNNQQQQAGQLGNAISSGAFGGDRSGIAAAVLAGQQNLAAGQVYSGIASDAYNQALGTAQQQQGVGLSAAQANRAATQQTGQTLAQLAQQGFGMGQTEAQTMAQLGQQGFAQGQTQAQTLAQLGQQGFAQGQTEAQTLAQLGQQRFGQGQTEAQTMAQLGQQGFAQGQTEAQTLAALGQQGFGQAQTEAQLQASLAGQGFGMGQTQAQTLAGLAQGQQAAQLQAGQAQLGAGQVQQQTNQAGQTALYNQFLQQQSYPFQTAQFLANIAEGTGALSGSTTTATQPGGLFMSDERLKEDMEPIGKGFDGANIYRFRYKGDPATRIGFSAQEMERQHPEAVHQVGGFKAVEQHAATEEAARRGGFELAANDNGQFDEAPQRRAAAADGGYQGFGGVGYTPGVNQFDIAAMLQAQEGSFGPYASSGLYGGQASGAPHGGSSYVPAANLPIAHLSPAAAPKMQQSDMIHQAAQDVSDVSSLEKSGEKGFDFVKGLHDAPALGRGQAMSDLSDSMEHPEGFDAMTAAPDDRARGGFARARRAIGGETDTNDISNPQDDDPYAPRGPGLSIPDAPSKVQPLTAPKAPTGQGENYLKDAMDIAKTAAMFMKSGGRAGFQGGGNTDVALAALAGGPTLDDQDSVSDESTKPVEPWQIQKALGMGDFPAPPKREAAPPPTGPTPVTINDIQRRLYSSSSAPEDMGSTRWSNQGPSGFASATSSPVAPPPPSAAAPSAPPVHVRPHPAGGNTAPTYTAALPAPVVTGVNTTPGISAPAGPGALTQPGSGFGAINPPPTSIRGAVGYGTANPGAQSPQDATGGFAQAARTTPQTVHNSDGSSETVHPGQPGHGLLSSLGQVAGGFGNAALGLMGYQGNGHWDRDKMTSFFTGLAGMLAAPTRYPLVALTQGLAQGTQKYMGLQQQEAGIAQTQAQAQSLHQEIFDSMQRAIPATLRAAGVMAQPGAGGAGQKTIYDHMGQPWHYALAAEALPGGSPETPAGGAGPATAPPAGTAPTAPGVAPAHRDPINVDYKTGITSIAPGSDADDYVQKNYGLKPAPAGMSTSARAAWGAAQLTTPGLQHQDAQERAAVDALPSLDDTMNTQRQYMQIGDMISKLPAQGLGAPGAGFAQRQDLANMYVTLRNELRGMGFDIPDSASAEQVVQSGQVLDKLRALAGPQIANSNNQHAHSIAELISSVLPGGQYQPEASRQVLATMMLQNQQAADHRQYGASWIANRGNAVGMNEAFQQEFGPRYQQEEQAIPRMLAKGPDGLSAADRLRSNPQKYRQLFEQGGKNPRTGAVVPGYGVGSSRLWVG